MKKVPFIQMLTWLYIFCIAMYMLFNAPTEAWKNYYWTVNKAAMLFALLFNYRKEKSKSEWLFVNFLTIQTSCIILYFSLGLQFYYKWMQQNDAVIYSFFIGGFLAMIALWLHILKVPQKTLLSIKGLFKGKTKTS